MKNYHLIQVIDGEKSKILYLDPCGEKAVQIEKLTKYWK